MKPVLNATAHAALRHSRLSPKRGWELMKVGSTPIGLKLLSLLLGIGATGLLVALEFPLEAILAAVAPILGFVADMALDGLEIILVPMLIACCTLSMLVKPDNSL